MIGILYQGPTSAADAASNTARVRRVGTIESTEPVTTRMGTSIMLNRLRYVVAVPEQKAGREVRVVNRRYRRKRREGRFQRHGGWGRFDRQPSRRRPQ